MTFDGATFDADQDQARLSRQLDRVAALMSDGHWRTLAGIAAAVEGSEAGVSARLRDLRKPRFGGKTVEGRRVEDGLWEYRLVTEGQKPVAVARDAIVTEKAPPAPSSEQGVLFEAGPEPYWR